MVTSVYIVLIFMMGVNTFGFPICTNEQKIDENLNLVELFSLHSYTVE